MQIDGGSRFVTGALAAGQSDHAISWRAGASVVVNYFSSEQAAQETVAEAKALCERYRALRCGAAG